MLSRTSSPCRSGHRQCNHASLPACHHVHRRFRARPSSSGVSFYTFPAEHWRKIWSTNPLERVNKEIKRRANVVGIFPNDAAVVRLVGAVLLETHEDWQIGDRRYFSEQSMAKLYPERDNDLALEPATNG